MKLIKVGTGVYRLDLGNKTMEAKLPAIAVYMRNEMGIKQAEIDFALSEMFRYDHDTAHFGDLAGVFTHTSDSRGDSYLLAQLRAIAELRAELCRAMQESTTSLTTHDVGQRLMHCYIALDVDRLTERLSDEVQASNKGVA